MSEEYFDWLEKRIEDYKWKFGKDVFELLSGDIRSGYKQVVEKYIVQQNCFETMRYSEEEGLKYLCKRIRTVFPIVTDVEGEFEIELPEYKKQVEYCEEEFPSLEIHYQSAAACDLKMPTKAAISIVKSEVCLFDILCEILYLEKKLLNKDIKEYCEIAPNKVLQDKFETFRRNCERRNVNSNKEEKKTISIFQDYGTDAPIKEKIIVKRGTKTRIENVIPQLCWVFILSQNLERLYGTREQFHYEYKNVRKSLEKLNKDLEKLKIKLSVLEEYALENVLGINLAFEITKMLGEDILSYLNISEKNELIDEIAAYVDEVSQWKGVYCRTRLVRIISNIQFPNVILSGTLVEQAKKKIRYLIQLTRVLMNSALDSYMQMLELIYTFVFSQAKTQKERIDFIEKKLLPSINEDLFVYKEYKYLEDVIWMNKRMEANSSTYELVQKCIIKKKEIPE